MTESIDALFVSAMFAAADEATSTEEVLIQRLDVAGVRIDLHYLGRSLHDMLSPALAHLSIPDDHTQSEHRSITIVSVWDTASSGIESPPPPVPRSQFTERGDLIGMEDPAYRVAFHWSEYSVCVFDVDARRAAYWVADPKHLPYWARSSPLRTILSWILQEHGRQLIHAAAVGTKDGAVVIAGSGGSGKSTTSLTCLDAGMSFFGDDYVAVSIDPPTVYSLYATAKIADAHHPAARRFPRLPSRASDEKIVLQLHPDASEQLERAAPIVAILTPEVVDRESTDIVGVGRDQLEHACTFTTLAQLPHAGVGSRTLIGALLDRVPSGLLRLGRSRVGVVEAVRHIAADPSVVRSSTSPSDLPLVSVVVPVHNGAHFLAAAIDSVLQQNYPHLEIIVVDDGSDDDVHDVVRGLPVDVRVHRQANGGPAAARNSGLALTSGNLVAFLDVDDRWPAGSLLAMVRDWAVGGAAVVIGRAQVVDLDLATGEERPIGTPDTAFPYYIGSALFDRRAFDVVGVFDPDMRFGEDVDWFARASESDVTVRRMSAVTLVVRRHGQNMTEGLSLVELHVVRSVKKALDRKRKRDDSA